MAENEGGAGSDVVEAAALATDAAAAAAAAGGADTVQGGGADTATGGAADTLEGGSDTVDGGGSDTLAGAAGDTLAGGEGGDQATPPVPEVDWRDAMAKPSDGPLRKLLERYTTPANFAKAHLALVNQLSGGEYRKMTPPPADASDEVKAAWRKSMDVPETADAYLEGLTFGDGGDYAADDKAILDVFAKGALEGNAPAGTFKVFAETYRGLMADIRANQEELDAKFASEREDELREEWGPQFRGANNAIKNMLETEGMDHILSGRGPDGRRFGDDPAVMKFLARMADEMNPVLRLTGGTGDVKTLHTELEELRAEMKDQTSDYHRNTKKQARFYELVELVDKLGKQTAAA